MTHQHKDNSGITLLELMIATAVLVVAITGLVAIFTRFPSLNENARKLSLAVTASQDKMEEIRNSDFGILYTTYNGVSFDPAGFPPSEAEGSIYIDNTNPNLLAIYVSVSWMESSNRIVGEDTNLNGILDSGEDLNGDERLNSPAEVVTLMVNR